MPPLSIVSLSACLLLAACSKREPSNITEHEASPTSELPQITLNTEHPPNIHDMPQGWFYQHDESEDPYSPDEPPALPITPNVTLSFAEELAQAALARTMHRVRYDGRYMKIAYPMGDVPADIGVCTDVVIRSYRELGIDLQQVVHEDIKQNFRKYPSRKRWGLRAPDTNIDHRRVYNLQVFFERHGQSLPISKNPDNYQPGDLVTWQIGTKMPHIGVVLELVSDDDPQRHLIAHNIGNGPVIDDMLFDFKITGHYRYQPEQARPVSREDGYQSGKS